MKFLILVLLSILFLSGCSQNYNWGWYILDPRLDSGASNIFFLISGLYVTVSISFFSIFFSILIGFFISLLAFSSRKEFVIINRFYIEIIRSIPILVLLLWVYYGLPIIFGISFGPFLAGVISLAVSDSAFEAEIFRAGIQSIGKGQKDAAKSIGLNRLQELRLVILPQALKNILPAIGNQFVYVLKMSSLVSIIGIILFAADNPVLILRFKVAKDRTGW